MDGTFEIVSPPFMQLFTINGFVQRDGCVKQLPLFIVIMSSRRIADYEAVFRKLRETIGASVAVRMGMLDFESAAWTAFARIFPQVELKGCYFHFSQALFRRMKRLGLSRAYCKDEGMNTILRQFLSLPLLPQNNIPSQWNRLNSLCSTPGLSEFSQYVGKTWIHVHKPPRAPECWSVHQMSVRTNNDIEGWHNRLKTRGKSHRTFYDLIQVMHEENSLLDWNLAQIRSGALDRRQNKDYIMANEELRILWDTLDCGKVTPEVFLLKASRRKIPYNEPRGDGIESEQEDEDE
jgi:hypothetical protein